MQIPITGSMLYSYALCPHRVTLDLFGDPANRDPVSPFVELLWERGNLYEREVVEGLEVPFLNLRGVEPAEERESRTREALDSGVPLIYGGRLSAGDLLGEPDLLRRRGDLYLPGDIKSGAGLEGAGEDSAGKPKKHYANQLALYLDILKTLGRAVGGETFVIDIRGEEVPYDLALSRGPKSPPMWSEYREVLDEVRAISRQEKTTTPALCSHCKLCHWRSYCFARIKAADDLTLIPELGRSRRDKLARRLPTVRALAETGPDKLVSGKKSLVAGIGAATILKFRARARLLKTPGARPYFTEEVSFPPAGRELFYDVETDPMRDVCYLHGFVVREGGGERFYGFFADDPTPESERRAFRQAWELIASGFTALYVYSSYEKTTLKKLAARHPDVAGVEEVEELFLRDGVMDLYGDLVRSKMEWPTHDLSIKTLAKFLGFQWRDTDPSGASSIQWYHQWTEERDPALKTRILEYNEDDCVAMRVLLDGVRDLEVGGGD